VEESAKQVVFTPRLELLEELHRVLLHPALHEITGFFTAGDGGVVVDEVPEAIFLSDDVHVVKVGLLEHDVGSTLNESAGVHVDLGGIFGVRELEAKNLIALVLQDVSRVSFALEFA